MLLYGKVVYTQESAHYGFWCGALPVFLVSRFTARDEQEAGQSRRPPDDHPPCRSAIPIARHGGGYGGVDAGARGGDCRLPWRRRRTLLRTRRSLACASRAPDCGGFSARTLAAPRRRPQKSTPHGMVYTPVAREWPRPTGCGTPTRRPPATVARARISTPPPTLAAVGTAGQQRRPARGPARVRHPAAIADPPAVVRRRGVVAPQRPLWRDHDRAHPPRLRRDEEPVLGQQPPRRVVGRQPPRPRPAVAKPGRSGRARC